MQKVNFKQLLTREPTFKASAPGKRLPRNDERAAFPKVVKKTKEADGVKKHSFPCQVITVSLGGNPSLNSKSNPFKPDAQPTMMCAEIQRAQLRVIELIGAEFQTANVITVH